MYKSFDFNILGRRAEICISVEKAGRRGNSWNDYSCVVNSKKFEELMRGLRTIECTFTAASAPFFVDWDECDEYEKYDCLFVKPIKFRIEDDQKRPDSIKPLYWLNDGVFPYVVRLPHKVRVWRHNSNDSMMSRVYGGSINRGDLFSLDEKGFRVPDPDGKMCEWRFILQLELL